MKKTIHIFLLILSFMFVGSFRLGDPTIIIIGNLENKEFITNDTELFRILSQQKIHWGDNKSIQIVAYNKERYINLIFYRKLNRINNFFDIIWTENRYLGLGLEPVYFDTEDEVISYIKKTPNAMGFITQESMNSEIKILYQF